MKNINIGLTIAQAVTQTVYMPTVTIKGQSTVNYILTGINEETSNVLFLDISWGDSPDVISLRKDAVYDYRNKSILYEILYGKLGGSVCTIQSHNYNNNTTSYGLSLSSSFKFYYDNGAIVTIYQPLNVFWGSFYDEIKELVAINTQITPTSSNYTYANFESKENIQIIPTILTTDNTVMRRPILKTTTLPPVTTTTTLPPVTTTTTTIPPGPTTTTTTIPPGPTTTTTTTIPPVTTTTTTIKPVPPTTTTTIPPGPTTTTTTTIPPVTTTSTTLTTPPVTPTTTSTTSTTSTTLTTPPVTPTTTSTTSTTYNPD